jgi:hypothetical protein
VWQIKGMRAITVSDAENSRALLQQEINRHQDARYDHRLHCVSLVATGMPCEQVARVFGDSPRSVAGWVRRFDARGLAGLAEGNHSGRPGRLTAEQMEEVRGWLRQSPTLAGLNVNLWDGKTRPVFAGALPNSLGRAPMPTVVSSTGFAVSPAASRRGKSRSVAPGGA